MADEGEQKSRLKRAKQNGSWLLGPTILYLDDVEAIYQLFRRVSDQVTLRLDGFMLDSPSDAASLSGQTKDFAISTNEPYASLSRNDFMGEFSFYVEDLDNLVLGGLREATMLIAKKHRLLAPGAQVLWVAWSTVLPLSLVVGVTSRNPSGAIPGIVGLVSLAFFAVLGLFSWNHSRGGRVILRDSHSKPSFLHANRDVVVAVIGTFIATVAGGVVLLALAHALGW
jgi:hypothetical protein